MDALLLLLIGFSLINITSQSAPLSHSNRSMLRDLQWCASTLNFNDLASHIKLENCLYDEDYQYAHGTISYSQKNSPPFLPTSSNVLVSPSQYGMIIEPAPSIRGQVFTSACDAMVLVIALHSSLLFTNNGFATYRNITVDDEDTEIIDVDSLALTDELMFIVSEGKIYSANHILAEQHFNFTLTTASPEGIKGISGPPICYRGPQMKELNFQLYAWNESSIFQLRKGVLKFQLLEIDASSNITRSIRYVELLANPDSLTITTSSPDGDTAISLCILRKEGGDSECGIVRHNVSNDTKMRSLASAKFYFLMWNGQEVTAVANGSSIVNRFNQTVRNVFLSQKRDSWIVVTANGSIYYGSLHFSRASQLNMTLPSEASMVLISQDSMFLISNQALSKIDIHDVMLATSAPRAGDDKQVFFNPATLDNNVIILGGTTTNAVINLRLISSRSDPEKITVFQQFGNTSIATGVKREMSSIRNSLDTVLRELLTSVTVLANCSRQMCALGYGLVELSYIPNESFMRNQARSYLYVISASCPAGLHLRLGNDQSQFVDCSLNTSVCVRRMHKNEQLFLRFQIWQDDEFMSDVRDNVLLTELQQRSGFGYHDFNLLSRFCYQCSNFLERPRAHQLVLQTFRGACPCRANDTNDSGWVGNLSFPNVYSTVDRDILRFSAKALSDSFCDLFTEFTVELISEPDLTFHYLEYVLLIICVTLTSALLCVSYYNYIKRTRNKQTRFSVTEK